MKYCIFCLLLFYCVVSRAVSFEDRHKSIDSHIFHLEQLLSEIPPKTRRKVTHAFRDGTHMHNYYLGCLSQGNRAGLISSDWKSCIYMRKNQLDQTDLFIPFLEKDRDLERTLLYIHGSSYQSENSGGYWKSDHQGEICMSYVREKPGGAQEFCFHSYNTGVWDARYPYLLALLTAIVYVPTSILPCLLLFSKTPYRQ